MQTLGQLMVFSNAFYSHEDKFNTLSGVDGCSMSNGELQITVDADAGSAVMTYTTPMASA